MHKLFSSPSQKSLDLQPTVDVLIMALPTKSYQKLALCTLFLPIVFIAVVSLKIHS